MQPFTNLRQAKAIFADNQELPTIFFSDQALKRMFALIQESAIEINWIGRVIIENQKKIIIPEIYLLKQERTGATCEIIKKGIFELEKELNQIYQSAEKVDEIWTSLLFFGHSHAYMEAFSSAIDDDSINVFIARKPIILIQGIFNKHGNCCLSLFIPKLGLKINNVHWSRLNNENFEISDKMIDITKQEIAKKVKKG